MVLDSHPWTIEFAWRFLCLEYDNYLQFLDDQDPYFVQHLSWFPLKDQFVKLNIGGSYDLVSSNMGAGGVIRDINGGWMRGFHKYLVGNGDALLTEVTALKMAMELMWDMGICFAICEIG